MTSARVRVFGAPKRSRITLNTRSCEGSVNTIITRPRSPGACTKASMELSQMALQRKVALGLALLGAAQHGVQLVDRLARHEGAQQRDRRADHRQVDVKIGIGVAEQRADVVARQQHRFTCTPSAERRKAITSGVTAAVADQAADQKGVAAAIEQRLDQLDRFWRGAGGRIRNAGRVRRSRGARRRSDVAERLGERQVAKHIARPRRERRGGLAHPVDPNRHRAAMRAQLVAQNSTSG